MSYCPAVLKYVKCGTKLMCHMSRDEYKTYGTLDGSLFSFTALPVTGFGSELNRLPVSEQYTRS
jgi:hypothetical protein